MKTLSPNVLTAYYLPMCSLTCDRTRLSARLAAFILWFRCKPILSSLRSVHRSTILWLSRWISANKQSHQVLRIMSSNWQILWYHYAKSFEANDSDATTSFTCHFKTKPIWGVCLDNTTMASLLLWLSRWKSAFKPSEWPWCMMSRNWQRIWYHHAKGSEANDSEA